MKNGTSETTTTIIRNSNIGRDYMFDCCDRFEPLYDAWCSEIDNSLAATSFWHDPSSSEVCGPVDAELSEDEFSDIMNAAYERACEQINASYNECICLAEK